MIIPCTNCNQRLEIPEELEGQTIECPACNASLTVPSAESPPSSSSQGILFCSKCGTKQEENAKFCHSCGQSLTETKSSDSTLTSTINIPQVEVTTSQTTTPSKVTSPKKSKSLIPKLAIAAVVGVVVVVLIMFFLGPQQPTSIHFAAGDGNTEAVKQYLAADTDVNVKNALGLTPLHKAAWNGRKEVAELLLDNGADVNANAKGLNGDTPLDLGKNYPEIADLLRKHGGKTKKELKAEDTEPEATNFDFETLLSNAEAGDANEQFWLGFAYHVGKGVAKDDFEAVKWFRKAAEQGIAQAQNKLGEAYDIGEGVPEDPVEAAKWFRKAAEQGIAQAQLNLGGAYHIGRGLPKNYVEAYKWSSLAAVKWNETAQFPRRNIADRVKRNIADRMTKEQIAEAQKRVSDFKSRSN